MVVDVVSVTWMGTGTVAEGAGGRGGYWWALKFL